MPAKKVTPKGTAAKPANSGTTKTATVKKAATPRKPAASKPAGKKHIRNIRGVDVRLTFESGRRVQLTPRGQRGDLTAVSKEELEDPIFLNNLGVLYEVIDSKTADKVRAKQNTNASLGYSRPEDLLTNERGESIAQVNMQQSFENQGKTIATLQTTDGRVHEEKSIDVVRGGGTNPQRASVPGSIDGTQPSELGTALNINPLPPISERE